MAVLDFDGVDDYVQSATLGIDITGALTIVAVVERDAISSFQAIITLHNATVPRLAFEFDGAANKLQTEVDGATASISTTAVTSTTETFFVGFGKPAGSSVGRFHLKNLTTLGATVHEAGSTAIGNPSTQAGGFIKLGNYGTGNTDDYNGPIAMIAVFDSDLGDAGIDTILAARTTSAVYAATPKLLVELNATTPVDLMGLSTFNAATGATLTGPDPTNWTMNGTGGGAVVSYVPHVKKLMRV